MLSDAKYIITYYFYTLMKCFYKILLLFLLIIANPPAFAQKTKVETGEYAMRIEDNTSKEEAKNIAIHRAQVNAIENAFGKTIEQDNTTYIQNKQNGEQVHTNTTFNAISNTYLKGEWVEDIKEPEIAFTTRSNETWIKVTVKGRVREITTIENKFETHTLSCPDIKCQTQQFNDGQDVYVGFKSPEDGYLTIYLTDPDTKYTYLYLPYKGSQIYKKCVPVKADQAYIFFSKQHDYCNEKGSICELTASVATGNNAEKNQLWVLFSTQPLDKPALEDEAITTKKFLAEQDIKNGYTLPKGMETDKFREWLQDYRVHNKKVQLESVFFDVYKK